AIEGLKSTDPEKYEQYRQRILLESIAPRFTILDRHAQEMTNAEFLVMAQEFKKDATYFNMDLYGESGKLINKYKSWGIA
ncbi:MAG: hypothetical protein IKA88_02820, partial [Clostridia bacterium]|nr:hypothetical protein [Clostridia bacterium]